MTKSDIPYNKKIKKKIAFYISFTEILSRPYCIFVFHILDPSSSHNAAIF